jgi:thioredoxin 1
MMKEVNNESEYKMALAMNQMVLIDFYASWCGPCKGLAPKLEQLAKKYPKVAFIKLNVDNQDLSRIVGMHNITAMPTTILFKGGMKKETIIGADIIKIESAINKHIS